MGFYTYGHTCAPIRRKLRAICAKIKSKWTGTTRVRRIRKGSLVLARADARFEWLIFFLLSSLLPLTPADSFSARDFPSSFRGDLISFFISLEDETTSALMEDISPLIMINLWDERARTSNPGATGGAGDQDAEGKGLGKRGEGERT